MYLCIPFTPVSNYRSFPIFTYLHGLDRTKRGKDQNWLFAFGEMKLMLSAVKTNKCCI